MCRELQMVHVSGSWRASWGTAGDASEGHMGLDQVPWKVRLHVGDWCVRSGF